MLSASVRRDGTAAMLQREALQEGRSIAADVARAAGPARPIALTPEGMLLDSLSGKVLGAWLQNRHQTLYPLAMNLRNIPAEQIEILLDVAAVALLATGVADPARLGRVHAWLVTVGGTDAHRDVLSAAVASAPTLHSLIQRVLEAHLGPFGFAVALAALDQREAVNRVFLEFLAIRLGLPSDMSRSLAQRYRL
jgi:hypothetical protein